MGHFQVFQVTNQQMDKGHKKFFRKATYRTSDSLRKKTQFFSTESIQFTHFTMSYPVDHKEHSSKEFLHFLYCPLPCLCVFFLPDACQDHPDKHCELHIKHSSKAFG